jgi:hypothetical protein
MSLFKKAEMEMAYVKAGILGFAGAGKSYTATQIAIGIIELLRERGLPVKNRIYWLDTETGSDFMKPIIEAHGIELFVAKTRAFTDLLASIPEMTANADVGIFDSITHFWVEFIEAYKKKKVEAATRKGFRAYADLSFQDWGILKPEWAKFTDLYVNSPIHLIICGRAGYEYDYFENDQGKMELYKTGTKMKTENELGFEPSLLLEMERLRDPEAADSFKSATNKKEKGQAAKEMAESRAWVRRCYVLKDRTTRLDGKVFDNPTCKDFLPHFEFLGLGGKHLGVDTSRTSDGYFGDTGESFAAKKKRISIILEEIQGVLVELWPGSTKEDKLAKATIIYLAFNTRSWTAVENMDERTLEPAKARIQRLAKVRGQIKDADFDDYKKYVERLWELTLLSHSEPEIPRDSMDFGAQKPTAPPSGPITQEQADEIAKLMKGKDEGALLDALATVNALAIDGLSAEEAAMVIEKLK